MADRTDLGDGHVRDVLMPLFDELRRARNPARRGTDFEVLLQKLFRLNGWECRRDSPIAKPRQTDLLARKAKQLLLLEAKWIRDSIDIDVLDSVKARLERSPAGTVGCIFSMSGFTKSVKKDVRQLRSARAGGYEILLFDPADVSLLLGGGMKLDLALATKLRGLREDGQVVSLDGAGVWSLPSLEIPFPLPDVHFQPLQRAARTGRAYDFAFGDIPPSFDRWSERIHGFELITGVLPITKVKELRAVLEIFHSHVRLSGEAGYSITQLGGDKVWIGSSVEDLLSDLNRRKDRYREASISEPHHSEEFSFFDATRVGALYVAGRHNVSSDELYGVRAELRLPAIPLDIDALEACMRTLGGSPELIPVHGELIEVVEVPAQTLVEPLEYLRIRTDKEFVGAAIVENPFWRPGWERNPDVPEPLGSVSFLVGRMGDWLAPNERVSKFHLSRIRLLHFQHGVVVDASLRHYNEFRTRVDDETSKPRGSSRNARPKA